ncbi:MAG: M1 family aminopeptidase [Bacteroidota bacterium]
MTKAYIFLVAGLLACSAAFSQFTNVDSKSGIYQKEYYKFEPKSNPQQDKYDVKFYFLDIALERTTTYISGKVRIDATVTVAQLDTFCFDLSSALTIDSVYIDGVKKAFTRTGDEAFVKLTAGPTQNQLFQAIIYYKGQPVNGGFFSGISHGTSGTWGAEVVWTLSEPFNAYHWWPCKQALTDKADSCWVFVTTSNTNKVGSNGILTNTVTVPGSKNRYEWKHRHIIEYYLISVAVAKYVDYTIYAHPAGITDSVKVQNYIYDNSSCLPYFKTEIDRTPGFIELFSDLFGIYPFYDEKYGHSMAPMGGGMEHQTMTTQSSFSFYLTCHELGHQWWGDYVTCATWNDIWINEGFASYCEYFAAQYLDSYTEAQSHMYDVHDNVMSQPDGSVYVPMADIGDVNRIFDGRLSYDKGSAIIHNLRFEVGNDTVFFDILKTFMTQYGNDVATGLDFKAVTENLSGFNFTDYFNQWYFGEGFPTFSVNTTQAADTLYMNVTQTTSTAVTPLFKGKMEYKLYYSGGDTTVVCYQTANLNSFKVHVDHSVTSIEVDPNNWVVNATGSITVNIDKAVSEMLNFSVSPNPVKENLIIYFPPQSGKCEIKVLDMTGKVCLTAVSEGTMFKASMANLNSGVYGVYINSQTGSGFQKFVLTK